VTKKTPGATQEVKSGTSPERSDFFDKSTNVKLILISLYILCALVLGLDYFIDRHGGHPWEGLFGFHALYGFVVCVILVLAAKELRKILQRSEEYYGSEDDG